MNADPFNPNAPALTPDDLLVKWQQAKDTLVDAIKTEIYYRNLAINMFFPTINKNNAEGVENYELGNNYKLKATFKLNYSLDKEQVDDMLDTLEKTGEDGKFISERIVKWSPNLSLTEYRQLTPEQKQVVDKVLTIKPATPSLEIVEPKK